MSGDAPELWNEKFPEKIIKLHKNAVDAGSDLFLTNSFGSNAPRLKLHNLGNRAFELSKLSAEIARDVADRYDQSVFVAGSVGPTGEIMHPIGELTHKIAVEVFHEQAQGLKDGGAIFPSLPARRMCGQLSMGVARSRTSASPFMPTPGSPRAVPSSPSMTSTAERKR
jgi:hypothetical protein